MWITLKPAIISDISKFVEHSFLLIGSDVAFWWSDTEYPTELFASTLK